MAHLIVRQLEEAIVEELRVRAAKAGVSREEEHRRILRDALESPRGTRSFKEHLLSIPCSDDGIFERERTVKCRK